MIEIKRDVSGIPGLDIGYGIISEKMEENLFFSHIFPEHFPLDERTGSVIMNPMDQPMELLELIELIKKELYPDLIQPDYCLGLTYPPKTGQFSAHYDSRYRWGEAVIGISLGRGSCMYFTKKNEKAIEIYLPPGSIYVMKGSSRYDYRHGIRKMTEKRMKELDKKEIPKTWNKEGVRRSITLRSHKMYSDLMLEYLMSEYLYENSKNSNVTSSNLDDDGNDDIVNKYKSRINDQNQYKAKNMEGRVIKKDLNDQMFMSAVYNFEFIRKKIKN